MIVGNCEPSMIVWLLMFVANVIVSAPADVFAIRIASRSVVVPLPGVRSSVSAVLLTTYTDFANRYSAAARRYRQSPRRRLNLARGVGGCLEREVFQRLGTGATWSLIHRFERSPLVWARLNANVAVDGHRLARSTGRALQAEDVQFVRKPGLRSVQVAVSDALLPSTKSTLSRVQNGAVARQGGGIDRFTTSKGEGAGVGGAGRETDRSRPMPMVSSTKFERERAAEAVSHAGRQFGDRAVVRSRRPESGQYLAVFEGLEPERAAMGSPMSGWWEGAGLRRTGGPANRNAAIATSNSPQKELVGSQVHHCGRTIGHPQRICGKIGRIRAEHAVLGRCGRVALRNSEGHPGLHSGLSHGALSGREI